jgi:hypothetical protein
MAGMLARGWLVAVVLLALGLAAHGGPARAQQVLPPVPNPTDRDFYDLGFDEIVAFSQMQNFEVVGHSYLRGPWLAPGARGAGINTPRVHDGIAYLAGYNTPPTMFGTLVVDVRNPRAMEPLTFLPGNPGTRTSYLRLNPERNILVVQYDRNANNPDQPAPGQEARGGWAFFDVSNPRQPVELAQVNNGRGSSHGFEIDDRYVYACGSTEFSKDPPGNHQELVIIDYEDPRAPRIVATWWVTGMRVGETPAFMDDLNPNGARQINQCHEVNKDGDWLYVAFRDVGMVILDVSDPTQPRQVGRFDYVPPFNGGFLGASHTAAPVPHPGAERAGLVVLTDEIFECPPGFMRLVDVSEPTNPVVISSTIIQGVGDNYDAASGQFVCPPRRQSIHQPYFDPRSPGSLVYVAWYGQGVRAFDISNPYRPQEVGYYLSPDWLSLPGEQTRQTREVFHDPQTDLLYMTDGNGGGLTALRYTGPIPPHAPAPGAR